MNYSTFYEFVLLAEVEKYAEVAEQVFISESTLARHIRMMESEIGVSLFDRTAKGIRLNAYGKALLPYAREAVDIWDNCIDEINEKKQREMNEISILCGYNVVQQLIDFHKREDSVVFSAMDEHNNNHLILQRLKDGQFGFAVMTMTNGLTDDVMAVPIKRFTYRVLIPENHRFASMERIPAAELQDEKLIDTYKRETVTDIVLQEYFQQNNVSAQVSANVVNLTEIIRAVHRGEGISIRRWTQHDRELRNVKTIALEPDLSLTIYLCWLKDRELRPIEKRFVEFMKDC